ncbi:MAG: hypothetical protein AAFO04_11625 [Cyanobacteria bacterium J06592_8]
MMNQVLPKLKFSKYQVINNTKLGVMMAVTKISFNKRFNQYVYTLAAEGLEPLLKGVTEANLEECKIKTCDAKNKSNCNAFDCPVWKSAHEKHDLVFTKQQKYFSKIAG